MQNVSNIQSLKNPAMPPTIERSRQVSETYLYQGYGWCLNMPKWINYKNGEIVGNNGCVYLHDTEIRNKVRYVMFQCKCGIEFEAAINLVKFGTRKSCGCRFGGATHKESHSSNHRRWVSMKQRCLKPKSKVYKKYGGRGIAIYKEWINNYESFRDYIMSLPNAMKEGYSLDRINNNGNYEPGNLRWATPHIQVANRSCGKYGYIGVHRDRNKWRASLTVNGKAAQFPRRCNIKDAVKDRNQYIIDNNLTEYPIQEIK